MYHYLLTGYDWKSWIYIEGGIYEGGNCIQWWHDLNLMTSIYLYTLQIISHLSKVLICFNLFDIYLKVNQYFASGWNYVHPKKLKFWKFYLQFFSMV